MYHFSLVRNGSDLGYQFTRYSDALDHAESILTFKLPTVERPEHGDAFVQVVDEETAVELVTYSPSQYFRTLDRIEIKVCDFLDPSERVAWLRGIRTPVEV